MSILEEHIAAFRTTAAHLEARIATLATLSVTTPASVFHALWERDMVVTLCDRGAQHTVAIGVKRVRGWGHIGPDTVPDGITREELRAFTNLTTTAGKQTARITREITDLVRIAHHTINKATP